MTTNLPYPIGDHLILRYGRASDAEELAQFNATWLGDDGPEKPEEQLAIWTRDVMARPHPTFTPELTTIVEDTQTSKIVSSIMLFPQTWSLDGIPFGVGRPELVATHPDYRGRGLIRRQMETLHAVSAAHGEVMQVITGIPWFYRQFGYEMALELGGGRMAYRPNVPELPAGETEPFPIRPAGEADIPFIMQTYAHTSRAHGIACLRDAAMWQYELSGRSAGNAVREVVCIIEDTQGQPVGYLGHLDQLRRKGLNLEFAGIMEGVSWRDVTPGIMRHLWQAGEGQAAAAGLAGLDFIYFALGPEHPIFQIFPNSFPRRRRPYAWYVRIADLPGFLTLIRPALEARLAESAMCGYTGRFKLDFYRSGIELVLNKGRITSNEPWPPQPGSEEGHASIPDLHFIEMICGQKTFTELVNFLPDCFALQDEYASLLNILFPKRPSSVWGVV